MRAVRLSLKECLKRQDILYSLAAAAALMIGGAITVLIPHKVFELVVVTGAVFFAFNALYHVYLAIRQRAFTELLYALLSLGLAYILSRYAFIPEWFIRVCFGMYCLISCTANLIQFTLDVINRQRSRFRMFFFALLYGCFGITLLFLPYVSTDLLLSLFGLYFMALGFRYFMDMVDIIHPNARYHWTRKIRITPPPLLCAFLPERALNTINHALIEGEDYELLGRKENTGPARLKIMVFAGSKGLQKVGHCCFAYDDIVYSYGNYDAPETGIGKVIGDGCYFNVPLYDYLGNMMWTEHNSIFQYDIQLTPQQEEKIEEQLQQLYDKSFRWYCDLEKNDGYEEFEKYEDDYPCRLHYRTGAKFYKIKDGRFRYYWFLGDNCASFMDQILGGLGADVLSMRGFITPGTYYDFLENEYSKLNSPVVARTVYPYLERKK